MKANSFFSIKFLFSKRVELVMPSHSTLSAKTLRRRLPQVMQILNPFGVPKSTVVSLVRFNGLTPQKATERIKAMQEARVEMVGLSNKLGRMTGPEFYDFIRRQSAPTKFNAPEEERHAKLVKLGFKERDAVRLAKRLSHRKTLEDKLKYFDSINLDPSVYGVRRIPIEKFTSVLLWDFNRIKQGIKLNILFPLEDLHAEKQLDAVIPGWRNQKSINNPKRAKQFRPSLILARVKACIEKGVKPTMGLITTCSAETILKKGLTLKRTTALDEGERKRMKDALVRFNLENEKKNEHYAEPTPKGVELANTLLKDLYLKIRASEIEKNNSRFIEVTKLIVRLNEYLKGRLTPTEAREVFQKAMNKKL
jgi:hypothetical protein